MSKTFGRFHISISTPSRNVGNQIPSGTGSHLKTIQSSNSVIARILAPGAANHNGALYKKYEILKKYIYLLYILLFGSMIYSLLWEENQFFFSFKIFILSPILPPLGLWCTGRPQHSLTPPPPELRPCPLMYLSSALTKFRLLVFSS